MVVAESRSALNYLPVALATGFFFGIDCNLNKYGLALFFLLSNPDIPIQNRKITDSWPHK